MAVDIFSDLFIDNLPESINWDSQVQALGYACDQNFNRLQKFFPQLLVLCNIPNLPESTLDLIAFQYQVLFYAATNTITDPDARLAAKRQLVANNFYYHAHLGTLQTVQNIVATVFMPAIVQEWFLYGGTANHFRILLQQVISTTLESEMLQLVNVVKRASQAFDGFYLYTTAPNEFYVAVGVFTQIWLFLPMPAPQTKINYVTMGLAIFASPTVVRASAVSQMTLGLSLTVKPRQVVKGQPVVDVRTGISVTAAIGSLQRAMVNIQMAEKVTTP